MGSVSLECLGEIHYSACVLFCCHVYLIISRCAAAGRWRRFDCSFSECMCTSAQGWCSPCVCAPPPDTQSCGSIDTCQSLSWTLTLVVLLIYCFTVCTVLLLYCLWSAPITIIIRAGHFCADFPRHWIYIGVTENINFYLYLGFNCPPLTRWSSN